MIRATRGLLVLAGLLATIQPSPLTAADHETASDKKRLITETDLIRFVWAADPQISPDGSRVAFVRINVRADGEGYETSLWLVSAQGGEPQRLTQGPRDSAPRWSADGTRLVFVRARDKDGKPQPPQLYLLQFAGGEPVALTDLPQGASAPAWSPDGRKIAFVSGTRLDELTRAEAKKDKPEHRSDVRVITRAVFRTDNEGYSDPKHPGHIWTVGLPTPDNQASKPKQLTSGPFEESLPAWSPEGARIYFLAVRDLEPYYQLRDTGLYSMAADGGGMQEVVRIDGYVLSYTLSRDGKRVAFRGDIQEPVRSYIPTSLFVCDATRRAVPRNLTSSFGYDVGGGLMVADQHPPRGVGDSPPIWNRAGTAILERVLKEGRTNLELFDAATGDARPFTTGDQEVIAVSATPDGSRLAALVSTPTIIGDIYLAGSAGAPMKRLTNLNEKLFAQVRIMPPEEFCYESFDGKKMHAFLQKPPDFDPKTKYPLILDIHGGLHAAYGFTFFHEFQWMAAKGYLVLYPNPRGSSSYGVEFANLTQYAFPGDDHKDLLAGIDELVRRGCVDPKRLGVTGGSGGGILTNWIIGHNDRFAAAVSQRSIADYAAWWYAVDGTLFYPNWFRSPPFDNPSEYVARSPLSYVRKIKTPLMLIEGESDFRTPPTAGGEMLFRALKYLKRPVVMVRFPNESHELSRSGNPWHRVERLQHIVNWFDKYLQGKSMPQYDLVPPEVKDDASQP